MKKWTVRIALALLLVPAAGAVGAETIEAPAELPDFGERYAAAWSGGDPEALAAFYEEDGTLVVNGGDPATGREAIAAIARSYMEAFPDMVVALDAIEATNDGAVFRWIWTGTYTGPGGNGASVRLNGKEVWTFGPNGKIALSDGHYDAAEYERQMAAGAAGE